MATAADGPTTAPCPPGQGPTTISKRVSLAEAAKLGAVKLTAKGGYAKDAVAVDATWKPADVPVTVQIDVEFSSFPGGPTAAQVEKSIEDNLPASKAADGTTVKFDIVARERGPGAMPSPCFHQTQLTSDASFRGEAGEADSDPLKIPQSGEWPTGRPANGDRQIWTHEALHLAGLEDQYVQVFRIGSKDHPIPDSVDIADPAAVKKWAQSKGLDYDKGKAGTKAKPGHEDDIMGDVFGGKEKLTQADVNRFALMGAKRLTIESKPGDVLLNKGGADQNLAVGAPFELTVEPGKRGHADGLVAYCIDLRRHSPSEGDGFDVLGPAGTQPESAMQYLQRVLEVAARLQTTTLTETPGAQDAIWRITDDSVLDDGATIYGLAGVPNETFNAPHFTNPNAASPETRAVSTTGVLPKAPPVPYLASLKAKPAKLAAGKARTVTAVVRVQSARDKVGFELQRRQGSEWRRLKRLGSEQLKPGKGTVELTIPAQRPGALRLVAIGQASSAIALIKVR
ncbi:MAG TPA: thioester domain-containing protein [Solirubrobacterales bacterium]|nr:thioester domain-containing protein [Solirubrobacterales bacterium]